jgi:hypothetical protein
MSIAHFYEITKSLKRYTFIKYMQQKLIIIDNEHERQLFLTIKGRATLMGISIDRVHTHIGARKSLAISISISCMYDFSESI